MIRHNFQGHNLAFHLGSLTRQHLSQLLGHGSYQDFSPSFRTPDEVKVNQRNRCICVSISCRNDHILSIINRVQQGFRYRFYPTKSQQIQLAKEFGCARFVYNWALVIRKNAWRSTRTNVGYVQCSEWLTVIKKNPETSWLKDVSAVTLQQSLRNLDSAFSRFFEKTANYPKFRKRKGPNRFPIPRPASSVRMAACLSQNWAS